MDYFGSQHTCLVQKKWRSLEWGGLGEGACREFWLAAVLRAEGGDDDDQNYDPDSADQQPDLKFRLSQAATQIIKQVYKRQSASRFEISTKLSPTQKRKHANNVWGGGGTYHPPTKSTRYFFSQIFFSRKFQLEFLWRWAKLMEEK